MHMFPSDNKISPRRELQGPRPQALMVGNDSFKIQKPQGRGHPSHRPPVIIHLKSPNIIQIKPQDFMSIVQQLTGKPSSSSSSSSSSVLAPESVWVHGSGNDLKIKKATDVEKDPEGLDMRLQNGGSRGIAASRAQSNFSPMYSGSLLPSPNLYSNCLDFGPIYSISQFN